MRAPWQCHGNLWHCHGSHGNAMDLHGSSWHATGIAITRHPKTKQCAVTMARHGSPHGVLWPCRDFSRHCHGTAMGFHGNAMTVSWRCHGSVMAMPWELQLFIAAYDISCALMSHHELSRAFMAIPWQCQEAFAALRWAFMAPTAIAWHEHAPWRRHGRSRGSGVTNSDELSWPCHAVPWTFIALPWVFIAPTAMASHEHAPRRCHVRTHGLVVRLAMGLPLSCSGTPMTPPWHCHGTLVDSGWTTIQAPSQFMEADESSW